MGPVDSVKIQLAVVLGKSIMPINQLLRMGRGAVIELDSTEEDDVEILANNMSIAHGEVSIHNDRIAVTIREMTKSTKRRANIFAPDDEAAPMPDEEEAALALESGESEASAGEAAPESASEGSEVVAEEAVPAPGSEAAEASSDEAAPAPEDDGAAVPEGEAPPALEDD